ncbi:uncharacterized protein LOC133900643 [Phragmites australis]|uniref:uncharacterized protein LOC133900643 n=1 Tax=Phragmites australis TaxID=29695 RepID=UPI002D764EF9|nr:uncharacterized protein LOC133900643 [Phragmites australis]
MSRGEKKRRKGKETPVRPKPGAARSSQLFHNPVLPQAVSDLLRGDRPQKGLTGHTPGRTGSGAVSRACGLPPLVEGCDARRRPHGRNRRRGRSPTQLRSPNKSPTPRPVPFGAAYESSGERARVQVVVEAFEIGGLSMERGDGGGMAPRGGGVVGSAAMLGLDMHLAAHPQQMLPAAFQQQPDHHHSGGFQLQQPEPVRQQQPSSFSPYSTSSSRAGHDEEMMLGNGCGGKGVVQQQQAGCPWTRMKWTDAMVRLLIRVVYSVGDDGEGMAAAGGGGGSKAAAGHGKSGSSTAHGHAAAQQQKKGKWKSVSRAMMDKGFLVSPQQCEDKFNDLNKRYKRVVDLLGRGRACRVVENHALLDAIDELTPKAKEEARKLLSSKHLFFREMCAYHNSGAAGSSHVAPHAAAAAGDAACLHHPPPAPVAAASSAAHRQAHAAPSMKDSSADAGEDDDDSEDAVSNNEEDDEDDYDNDDDGHMYHRLQHHNGGGRGKRGRGAGDGAAGDDLEDELEGGGKRARTASDQPSAMVQQLQSELASARAAITDPQQMRCWMRRRAVEVEEQQVALERRAYQLERQRLKWERFRANKERDMERARLLNDRLRIDGRRMLLMLRHRDLELDIAEANSSSVDHQPGALPLAAHQQQQIGSSPSTAGHPN